MNEQEKQELQELFIAICGYLPYGIKATYVDKTLAYSDVRSYNLDNASYIESEIVHIRPYLRSMSSMTWEEIEELDEMNLQTKTGSFKHYVHLTPNFTGFLGDVKFDPKTASPEISGISIADVICYINWLNAHHFDYYGLIEKGLAIEAPKDMYV